MVVEEEKDEFLSMEKKIGVKKSIDNLFSFFLLVLFIILSLSIEGTNI